MGPIVSPWAPRQVQLEHPASVLLRFSGTLVLCALGTVALIRDARPPRKPSEVAAVWVSLLFTVILSCPTRLTHLGLPRAGGPGRIFRAASRPPLAPFRPVTPRPLTAADRQQGILLPLTPAPPRTTHRQGGTRGALPFPGTGLEFGGEVKIEEVGKRGVRAWVRSGRLFLGEGGEERRGWGGGAERGFLIREGTRGRGGAEDGTGRCGVGGRKWRPRQHLRGQFRLG